MSLGERTPVALLNYGASARLAVAEALTNIAGTDIGDLNRIKLSANWMSPAGHPGEDAGLYEAVKAIGEDLCPTLGLTIPVGKDSMSMKTTWTKEDSENNEQMSVTSPMSLIITAFGRVEDIRNNLKEGDSVTAVIINVDRKNRGINLSIKALSKTEDAAAMKKLSSESSATAGTTNLGALLKAKMSSGKSESKSESESESKSDS